MDSMVPLYKMIVEYCNRNRSMVGAFVNVVCRLPDNKLTETHINEQGDAIILLKYDTMDNLKERLFEALERLSNSKETKMILHDGEIGTCGNKNYLVMMQAAAVSAAEQLGIDIPQIILTDDIDCDGLACRGVIMVTPKKTMVSTILHELRHIWQRECRDRRRTYFGNYLEFQEISGKRNERLEYYNRQVAEFDANAFAYAWLKNKCKESPECEVFIRRAVSEAEKGAMKAAEVLNTPVDGEIDYNRMLDYKSIYPDVIM